ncbi:MAG TPA: hypothetical protein VNB90_04305 [Cytophagaceae bacterium]|jgi:hypothetical protein|nr:hypothetical protein [Cytophagaceae bacterium]
MKKIVAIFFAFLILLQCSIKTGIVAYFHLNQKYIAETLCENKNNVSMHCKGKCYLKKKLKEQDKQESKLASILKELKDCTGLLSSFVSFSIKPLQPVAESGKSFYLISYFSFPLSEILQPPQS